MPKKNTPKKHSEANKPNKEGKHPGGRPKVQLKDLPENWKQLILDYASEGMDEVEIRVNLAKISKTESGKNICFSNDLWYRLIKDEPEFSETIKTSELICEAWWKNAGRVAVKDGNNFNHGLWYMNMKNRFKWHDRQEQIHSGAIRTHLDMGDFINSSKKYDNAKNKK